MCALRVPLIFLSSVLFHLTTEFHYTASGSGSWVTATITKQNCWSPSNIVRDIPIIPRISLLLWKKELPSFEQIITFKLWEPSWSFLLVSLASEMFVWAVSLHKRGSAHREGKHNQGQSGAGLLLLSGSDRSQAGESLYFENSIFFDL